MKARRDATPLVSPLERLTYLNTVPLLARLGTSELLALAESCEEVSYRRGRALVQADESPQFIHIIVSGQAIIRMEGRPLRRLLEHDSVGLLSLLSHRNEPLETIALTTVRTLAIPASAFRQVLEDRFSLFSALLRNLCRVLQAERDEQVELVVGSASQPPSGNPEHNPDSVVGRILVLQSAFEFGMEHPIALSQLAERAAVVRIEPEFELWKRGDRANAVYVICSGELQCVGGEEPNFSAFSVRTGQACGFIDAIADSTRSYAATAKTEIAALRIEREAVLDVLEDHFDLAESCLQGIAALAVAALDARAEATLGTPAGLLREPTAEVPMLDRSTLMGLEPFKPGDDKTENGRS